MAERILALTLVLPTEGTWFWLGKVAETLHAYSGARLEKPEGKNCPTVLPNVRAKRVTTAWRAGQQAQNGPQAQRLMASAQCRWRSA